MNKKNIATRKIILLALLIVCVVGVAIGMCAKPTVKAKKKTLMVGQATTVTFNPKGIKSKYVKKCTWSSSNKKVVKITTKKSKGKKKVTIKALKKGTAYIKVKCKKKTYKVKITVKNKPAQSTTEKATTEQATTEQVDPESLIGKLEVSSAWYYDPEGKKQVTDTLKIDKDNTSFTVYQITTYKVNGNPVPLQTLKNAYEHNAASMGGKSEEEIYETTLCDGETDLANYTYISDNWDKYTYLSSYSQDGKIVYQYDVYNDMNVAGLNTINFAVYTNNPQSYILGTAGDLGTFTIIPEFRNNVIKSIETIKQQTINYSYLKTELEKTYKKVTVSATQDSLEYTITHYQECINIKKDVKYCKTGDYIYSDTSKYNLGIYYRFEDVCDNCMNKKICSQETVDAIRTMKSKTLETVYFPKAYETWFNSWEVVYSGYYTGATCAGYTCINKTNQAAKGRLVYRYYWKTDIYKDGVYDDLSFSSVLK